MRPALMVILAAAFHAGGFAAEVACDPADPAFVCGVHRAEDLVRLEGTPWVVASQMTVEYGNPPHVSGPGPLQAVQIETHEVRQLYPTAESSVDWDRQTYPDCAAPPEFVSSHGLNVRPLEGGKFRLYVVNHGGRESVEIIDVAVRAERLQTAWRGCIRAPLEGPPKGVWPNDVTPLPGDAVALSGFHVAIWRPGQGWRKLEGLKIGLANGIEASRDGRWLFIADTTGRSIIRIPVEKGAEQTVLKLNFYPDNLKWAEDGNIYAAGPDMPKDFPANQWKTCRESPSCTLGFAIAQIDPITFTAREVYRTDGITGLSNGATVALQIGDRFWVGDGHGNRVAIVAPNR